MATAEPAVPVEAAAAITDAPKAEILEEGTLKRKTSHDDDLPGGSLKRTKQEESLDESPTRPRRRSPSPKRNYSRDATPPMGQERRISATQEEKKRSKRLFGGLLSTISQTTTNTQQKRRQEIERRQQERLQKQQAEDDSIRAERASRLNEIRLAEHIEFEGDVMRTRHVKTLSMAQFLRTRAEPHICYLPWKPTEEQERIIDAQIEDAKARIRAEVESFTKRKEEHVRRHGPSSRLSVAVTETPFAAPDAEDLKEEIRHDTKEPETVAESEPVAEHEPEPKKPAEEAGEESHDESGDVLEEGDEDMVIY